MKKITLFLVAILVFVFITPICNVSTNAFASEIELTSDYCVLMECETGKILFEKDSDKRGQIASMTKIMLLNLIFDRLDSGDIKIDDMVSVSERAMSMGGSQVFLDVKNKYAVSDLIKSIIVASANDSSVAMAEYIFGSVESAVCIMNETALKYGMNNTNFVNVTGLPHDDSYSTAKDVALMTQKLVCRDAYKKYSKIWMDKIPHGEDKCTEISNTNKLLKKYPGCDGGKTGFTNQAMHCISATAQKNGMRLIATVMHGKSSNARFQDAMTMFDYGFGGFERKEIVSSERPLEISPHVINGKKYCVLILPSESFYSVVKKGNSTDYTLSVQVYEDLKAPIEVGDQVGNLEIVSNGKVIDKIALVANENIERASILDNFKNLFSINGTNVTNGK